MENRIQAIGDELLPYAYWLSSIPGVGRKTINHLLTQIDSPRTLYGLSEKDLLPFLTQEQKSRGLTERLMSCKKNNDVHEEYQKLTKKRIHFTCLGHADYPKRLARIPDAPYGLYYIGRLPAQEQPSVAVIGARECSEYGKRMAQHFGSELAAAGVQIISGMARGIDGISQKEALAAGGYSLAVMGCGVDVCYPYENMDLYDVLCTYGGVCSEYAPGQLPKNTLFPPRNRIISALSDIVLVIEAKNRSGTLITVDMALEQGKEVYALPGRAGDALSEGCNRLIQQGAGMALSPQELLRALMENTSLPGSKFCIKTPVGARQASDKKSGIKLNADSETKSNIQCKIKPGFDSKANLDKKSGIKLGAGSETKSNIQSNMECQIKPGLDSELKSNMKCKNVSDIRSEIMDILSDTPKSVEMIKERLLLKYNRNISFPELTALLMKLSLCGMARQISNSYFVKG